MKKRLPVIIALVCGLLASVLVFFYMQKQQNQMGTLGKYLVASRSIKKDTKFSSKNMSVKAIPGKYAPYGAIKFSEKSNVFDTRATVDIRKGQVLLWEYVESGIETSRLSGLLSKGERAITISVDGISGLEGMIHPNDRVDVIGTFTAPSGKGTKTITTILNQNVTILAVGDQFGHRSGKSYSSVTLKVTPQEAEILTFAEGHGRLRLALRTRDDLKIIPDLPAVDFSNIISLEKRATHRKATKKPEVIYN